MGSVIGGTINASIAATLTTGIGLAWIAVCEQLVTMDSDEIATLLGDGSLLRSTFLTAFKDQVRKSVGPSQTSGTAA